MFQDWGWHGKRSVKGKYDDFRDVMVIHFSAMRLHNATGMRLLAAWFVLLEHSPRLLGLEGTKWGGWGLAIFFSLSGYMISQSARRSRNPWDFTMRRARRLGPAYIVAVLGTTLIVWPLFSHPPGFHLGGGTLLSGMYGILRWEFPGLFLTHMLRSANGSVWSLPYEILMYGFLGVLWFGWLRRTRLHGAIVPATIWGISTILLLGGDRILPGGDFKLGGIRVYYLVNFLALFAGGWTLAESNPSQRTLRWILLAVFLLRLALFAFPYEQDAVDAMLIPLGVVAIGHLPISPNRFLPDWSYGFYLWAWPVQQCLLDRFPRCSPAELTLGRRRR